MILAYAVKLGLTIRKTSVRVKKINSTVLETYGIVSAKFIFWDRLSRL